jgi:hypothetical protein
MSKIDDIISEAWKYPPGTRFTSNPFTQRFFGYDNPTVDWCDEFISCIAADSGNGDAVGWFAWVPSHAQRFRNKGLLGRDAVRGALAFFGAPGVEYHVGLCTSVTGSSCTIYEGNTNTSVYKDGETDEHTYSWPDSNIQFGYPDYASEPQPIAYPLVIRQALAVDNSIEEWIPEWIDASSGRCRMHPADMPDYALDVTGAVFADGRPVQIYPNNGTVAQEWHIVREGKPGWVPTENTPFIIESSNEDYVLNVLGNYKYNDTPVQLYHKDGTAANEWTLLDQGNGRFKIVHTASGLVLAAKQ